MGRALCEVHGGDKVSNDKEALAVAVGALEQIMAEATIETEHNVMLATRALAKIEEIRSQEPPSLATTKGPGNNDRQSKALAGSSSTKQ